MCLGNHRRNPPRVVIVRVRRFLVGGVQAPRRIAECAKQGCFARSFHGRIYSGPKSAWRLGYAHSGHPSPNVRNETLSPVHVIAVGFSEFVQHHRFLPTYSQCEHHKKREKTGRAGKPIGKEQSLSERR